MTKVPVLKLDEAARKRGIRINITLSEPGSEGRVHADVEQVVTKGDDEETG